MKPDATLFTLQSLVNKFSHVERNHYRAQTDNHETDVEHSFTVALLSWYLVVNNNLELDLEKVLKYALVHDLVEVYAGDVNAFASQKEREDKVMEEGKALRSLSLDLAEFSQLTDAIIDYEKKADEESLFVWTVDKMQALIMGDLDGWRPYKELSINYQSFADKYSELLSKSSKYAESIFDNIIEYCKRTYYSQPK